MDGQIDGQWKKGQEKLLLNLHPTEKSRISSGHYCTQTLKLFLISQTCCQEAALQLQEEMKIGVGQSDCERFCEEQEMEKKHIFCNLRNVMPRLRNLTLMKNI